MKPTDSILFSFLKTFPCYTYDYNINVYKMLDENHINSFENTDNFVFHELLIRNPETFSASPMFSTLSIICDMPLDILLPTLTKRSLLNISTSFSLFDVSINTSRSNLYEYVKLKLADLDLPFLAVFILSQPLRKTRNVKRLRTPSPEQQMKYARPNDDNTLFPPIPLPDSARDNIMRSFVKDFSVDNIC